MSFDRQFLQWEEESTEKETTKQFFAKVLPWLFLSSVIVRCKA